MANKKPKLSNRARQRDHQGRILPLVRSRHPTEIFGSRSDMRGPTNGCAAKRGTRWPSAPFQPTGTVHFISRHFPRKAIV